MADSELRVRDILACRGMRCTRQREEILAALRGTTSHPTAEELHRAVKVTQPGISLATVYNALESFTRLGLCRRLPPAPGAAGGAGGASRFDGNVDSHVHMVSAEGEVRDVPDDLGERILAHIPAELIREVEGRLGVRVGRVSVDLVATPDQGDAAGAGNGVAHHHV